MTLTLPPPPHPPPPPLRYAVTPLSPHHCPHPSAAPPRALTTRTPPSRLPPLRYAVIPLSPNSGLIGWVPNCDTLHALIREYRCGEVWGSVGIGGGVLIRELPPGNEGAALVFRPLK